MSSEDSVVSGSSETPTSQPVVKPAKEKKPRTEAQQAATAKALAAMTAKRKEQIEKKKEVKEKVKVAKKIVEEKIIKEDLGLVTKQDFDSIRKEIMELRAMQEATKIVKAEKEKAPPVKPQERIVERVFERPAVTAPPTPTKLTGHALLDRVFGFEK